MSLKTNTLTGRHKMPALMDAKSPHITARACLLVSLREAPPAEVLILINDRRKKTCFKSRFFECGRRERIRTSDPLVPNQLRYQAALLADAGRILLLAVIGVNHFFAPALQVVIKAP
jgi:hypothetical protein